MKFGLLIFAPIVFAGAQITSRVKSLDDVRSDDYSSSMSPPSSHAHQSSEASEALKSADTESDDISNSRIEMFTNDDSVLESILVRQYRLTFIRVHEASVLCGAGERNLGLKLCAVAGHHLRAAKDAAWLLSKSDHLVLSTLETQLNRLQNECLKQKLE